MKKLLIDILRASGNVLLEYFNGKLIETEKESQSSIVTDADIASEKVIINLIRDVYPHHNIISEETGFIDNRSKITWIIDPLDGTSNFSSGIPWFGILIAVLEDNEPVMSGAYLPVQDLLYYAEKGKGAERNGEKLPKINYKDLRESLVAFSVDYTEDKQFLDHGLNLYRHLVRKSRNIRSTNSLFDFIYTAEGKFGIAVNLNTRIWDIAGPGLLISETGGTMRLINGSPVYFDLNHEITGRNFPVIAGSERNLNQLFTEFN